MTPAFLFYKGSLQVTAFEKLLPVMKKPGN